LSIRFVASLDGAFSQLAIIVCNPATQILAGAIPELNGCFDCPLPLTPSFMDLQQVLEAFCDLLIRIDQRAELRF